MTVGVNVPKAIALETSAGIVNESGGGAGASKINDDSDSTYIRSDGATAGRLIKVMIDDTFLSGAERVGAIRYRIRVKEHSGTNIKFAAGIGWYESGLNQAYHSETVYTAPFGSPTWLVGPWHGTAPDGTPWSQPDLYRLSVRLKDYKASGNLTRFYEVWADVLLMDAVTATVTDPAEASTFTSSSVVSVGVSFADADDSVGTVTNKVLTSNVATLTIGAHKFGIGDGVVVAGVGAPFDGDTWEISAVGATTISYPITNANISSGAATGTVTSRRNQQVPEVQYRVFSAAQYGAADFTPTSSPATWEGTHNLESFSATPGVDTYQTGPLPNGTYRVYARAYSHSNYQDAGQALQGPWDYNQFTLAFDPPGQPVMSATYDSANNRVDLTVNGRRNVLTEQDGSLETVGSSGTWVADTNASSIARVTTDAASGTASLQWSATGAADTAVRTGVYAVAPSTAYRAVCDIKTVTATRSVRVDITWLQSDGTTVISTSTGTASTTAGTSAYETRTVDATSPSNAAFARVRVYAVGAAAANVFRVDKIGLWPEQSGSWTPGGTTDTGFLIERSDDGGTTWATIVGGAAVQGGVAQYAALKDYAAPRGAYGGAGVTVRYRATQYGTTEAGFVAISAPSTVVTATTSNDGAWWLKAALDPALNRGAVKVLASPDYGRVKEQNVDRPIGRSDGLAVVTTGTVGGMDAGLRIATRGESEWAAIDALLTHAGPVLIQDPWGRQRWVALGDYEWVERGGAGETYRTVGVESIQVGAPL